MQLKGLWSREWRDLLVHLIQNLGNHAVGLVGAKGDLRQMILVIAKRSANSKMLKIISHDLKSHILTVLPNCCKSQDS